MYRVMNRAILTVKKYIYLKLFGIKIVETIKL